MPAFSIHLSFAQKQQVASAVALFALPKFIQEQNTSATAITLNVWDFGRR